MRKNRMIGKMFVILLCIGLGCQARKDSSLGEAGRWAVRMAESIMIRSPEGYGEWDYVTGTVLRGFQALWEATRGRRFFAYIQKTVDAAVGEDGSIRGYRLEDYNIDEINEGRLLLFLYRHTGKEKYKKAADRLRRQLAEQPRNEAGGFWHKKKYPFQMWLDGLYMGAPFYVEYGKMFGQPENIDDAVHQFVLLEAHARDPRTGLLYHGWDESRVQEWADPTTGLSSCFWGRGMGWYAMALVDVIELLPDAHPGRAALADIFRRLAQAIRSVQDPETGVWWQVLDRGGQPGNYLEASASCMFVYALAKGLRMGLLDPDYRDAVAGGYRGILQRFVTESPDGTLNLIDICRSAGLGYGRDGSYAYYVAQEPRVMNDGKGLGPFILACLEVDRLGL